MVSVSRWVSSVWCTRSLLRLCCVSFLWHEEKENKISPVLTPFSLFISSSASLTPAKYRYQTTIVHSLHAYPPYQPGILSRLQHPGLSYPPPPTRDSFNSTVSTLAFHPYEMLLGIGGSDGTIQLVGCKLTENADSVPFRDHTYPAQVPYASNFTSIRSESPWFLN